MSKQGYEYSYVSMNATSISIHIRYTFTTKYQSDIDIDISENPTLQRTYLWDVNAYMHQSVCSKQKTSFRGIREKTKEVY